MATSRFNKFLNSDYNMQFYQPQIYTPNFELLGNIVQKAEGEKQQLDQLTDLPVDYLQGIHDNQAKAVLSTVDKLKQEVTDAYASGDISLAKSKMMVAKNNISKLWKPGGDAYNLAATKKAYLEKVDEIQKNVKGDNNRNFALNTLKQNTIDLANKNQVALGTPEIYDYQDIYKDANDLATKLKETDLTKESDILGWANSHGINVAPKLLMEIKREGVTPERIKAVVESMLHNPKYANQKKVDLWATYGYSDNLPQATKENQLVKINQANDTMLQQSLNSIKTAKNKELSAAKSSKDKQNIITKYKDYENKVLSQYSPITDLKSFYEENYNNEVIKSQLPFAYQKIDRKYDWTVYKEANDERRFRTQMAKMDAGNDAVITGLELKETPININDMYQKSIAETTKQAGNLENVLTNQIGLNKGNQQDKFNVSKSLLDAAQKGNVTSEMVKANPSAFGLQGYSSSEIDKVVNNFNGNKHIVASSYEASKKAYETKVQTQKDVAAVTTKYEELPKVKEAMEDVYNKYIRANFTTGTFKDKKDPNAPSYTQFLEDYKAGKLDEVTFDSDKTKTSFSGRDNSFGESYKGSMGYYLRKAIDNAVTKSKPEELEGISKKRIYAMSDKDTEAYTKAKTEQLNAIGLKGLTDVAGGELKLTAQNDKSGKPYTLDQLPGFKIESTHMTNEGLLITGKVKGKEGKETLYTTVAKYAPEDIYAYEAVSKKAVVSGLKNGNKNQVTTALQFGLKNNPEFNYDAYSQTIIPVNHNSDKVKLKIPGQTSYTTPLHVDFSKEFTINGKTVFVAKGTNNQYMMVKADASKLVRDSNGAVVMPEELDVIKMDYSTDPLKSNNYLFNSPEEVVQGIYFLKEAFDGKFNDKE